MGGKGREAVRVRLAAVVILRPAIFSFTQFVLSLPLQKSPFSSFLGVVFASSSSEGQMLVEAGNVLKRVSALDAQEQLEAAAQVYIQQGRWGQAAKIYRSIAEMYEEEGCHTTSSSASSCSSSGLGVGGGLGGSSPSMLLDSGGGDSMNKVMTFYRKAAETYELDEYGKSAYSQCRCKYAEYAAKNDNTIDEALRIFEQEGDKATRNNLLQFSKAEGGRTQRQ